MVDVDSYGWCASRGQLLFEVFVVGSQVACVHAQSGDRLNQRLFDALAVLAFALKVALRSSEIVDDDFAALRAHGFADEDIWDIGAIAAFFALSNRMANLIDMKPNPEFYLLGRLPRDKTPK